MAVARFAGGRARVARTSGAGRVNLFVSLVGHLSSS